MTDFLPYNRYEHFIARGRAAPALRTAVVHSCSPEAILAAWRCATRA
jgi:phosphate acetyltransferase